MGKFIVAIDGPAGSGKSSVAKIIAKKYNFTYLDTGAMYRMIALYSIRNNIDIHKEKQVKKMLDNIHLDIKNDKFYMNGEDVSTLIRTPEINKIVSDVATIKMIRQKLLNIQREMSKGKKVILDGRDIGSVVFPNANLKIFLIATPEIRAKRRLAEYDEKNVVINYDEVLESIKKRDYIDSHREESPLIKTSDAITIDTSKLDIDGVVNEISKYIDDRNV